jgi:hypothetical protein
MNGFIQTKILNSDNKNTEQEGVEPPEALRNQNI